MAVYGQSMSDEPISSDESGPGAGTERHPRAEAGAPARAGREARLSAEAKISVAVTISIPTYRRPDKLRNLLASLEPSLASAQAETIEVIVADNACEAATKAVVEAFQAHWPRTRYLPVPERGISAARNALIGAFLNDSRAPWLAMLDDDLVVGTDWLARLLEAGEAYGTDAVGAPYQGRTEAVASAFVRASLDYRIPRPSGPCAPLTAGGNVLLSRALLTRTGPPWFAARYGLSGGEDYDFFRRAAAAGATFAWTNAAAAEEDIDADRLTARAVLARYYSTGNYMALIDAGTDGRARTAALMLAQGAKSLAGTALGAARRDRGLAVRHLLRLAFTAGALSALVGSRVYRYRDSGTG